MDFQFERPQENKSSAQAIKIFKNAVRFFIYLMVFLVPLFLWPSRVDIFDFNKQYIIWALVGLSAFLWWVRMIFLEKKVVWKRTPLDIPILIFLAANILTAVFSIDRYLSIWGGYGAFSESLINLIVMVILYFVVVNNF